MISWREIIGKLLGRKVQPQSYAAQPSAEQIAHAHRILDFAGSEAWESYSDYICISLGEAMEAAFVALKKGDVNAMTIWVARADSLYRLLTLPYDANSIIEKSKQIIVEAKR